MIDFIISSEDVKRTQLWTPRNKGLGILLRPKVFSKVHFYNVFLNRLKTSYYFVIHEAQPYFLKLFEKDPH